MKTALETMEKKLELARQNVQKLEAIQQVMEEVKRQKEYCQVYVRDEETGERVEGENGEYLMRDPKPDEWNYQQFSVWSMVEQYLLQC